MTLTLDIVTEKRLQDEMQRGGYASAEDLIRAALDVMQEADKDVDAWKLYFSDMLGKRSANVDNGAFYTPEEAKAKLAQMRAVQVK